MFTVKCLLLFFRCRTPGKKQTKKVTNITTSLNLGPLDFHDSYDTYWPFDRVVSCLGSLPEHFFVETNMLDPANTPHSLETVLLIVKREM